ncbi:hypothetical protein Hypma_001854 [Hypsizygus marmoreus]|uniref:Uncharacterized protein n=1 Tax=Hypsizygus marmoreus TaxID=39966 RepID=A0A369J886_HYPMA|nr:hypothetical protein Hypma_001854 [Hypsizygus marmoreus]
MKSPASGLAQDDPVRASPEWPHALKSIMVSLVSNLTRLSKRQAFAISQLETSCIWSVTKYYVAFSPFRRPAKRRGLPDLLPVEIACPFFLMLSGPSEAYQVGRISFHMAESNAGLWSSRES